MITWRDLDKIERKLLAEGVSEPDVLAVLGPGHRSERARKRRESEERRASRLPLFVDIVAASGVGSDLSRIRPRPGWSIRSDTCPICGVWLGYMARLALQHLKLCSFAVNQGTLL